MLITERKSNYDWTKKIKDSGKREKEMEDRDDEIKRNGVDFVYRREKNTYDWLEEMKGRGKKDRQWTPLRIENENIQLSKENER